MRLHLVGGFLGSGKTTAIVAASKQLAAKGKIVGVVTNDQGKYLVDTAFAELAGVPAVEVTGGCFCCRYDDLRERLDQLDAESHPDVVFAESVGSCADLAATVLKPLLEIKDAVAHPASFSVFSDIRLFQRRQSGQPLPFSDDVIYIYDKQIEEAETLILNKSDLMPPDLAEATRSEAESRFPDKTVRLQNSLDESQAAAWLRLIEERAAAPDFRAVEVDYDRYGDGEVMLAWLDEEIRVEAPDRPTRPAVEALIEAIVGDIRDRELGVGHLKFIVRDINGAAKVSVTALDAEEWREQLPALEGWTASVAVNARIECGAEDLRAIVEHAVLSTGKTTGAKLQATQIDAFHPGRPVKPAGR